jgi:uncharacterized protein YjdB
MRWLWRGLPLIHAVLLGSACGVTDTDEASPVNNVVVTPTTLELTPGATAALDAQVVDAEGKPVPGRRIVWASANSAIASVSERGVVTAVAAGHVGIAATAEGKSAVAAVTVLPAPARVATVRIEPDRVDLVVAAGTNLVATPYDSRGTAIPGRTAVWTTNNATVAAISQTGRVTALVPGTAVITAIIDNVAGNATVNVTLVPVARVTVSPANPTVAGGRSITLTARLTDAVGNVLSGRAISWSSADTRIANVDQSGVVQGVRKGSVVITATSEGKSGTATVTVQ